MGSRKAWAAALAERGAAGPRRAAAWRAQAAAWRGQAAGVEGSARAAAGGTARAAARSASAAPVARADWTAAGSEGGRSGEAVRAEAPECAEAWRAPGLDSRRRAGAGSGARQWARTAAPAALAWSPIAIETQRPRCRSSGLERRSCRTCTARARPCRSPFHRRCGTSFDNWGIGRPHPIVAGLFQAARNLPGGRAKSGATSGLTPLCRSALIPHLAGRRTALARCDKLQPARTFLFSNWWSSDK